MTDLRTLLCFGKCYRTWSENDHNSHHWYQLNGGRFESYRDFQMLVADNVINKIKESLLDVKDHDDDNFLLR
jgi:hypothetical protein